METQSKLWPADPNYGDTVIWDAAIEIAYKLNELEDVIRLQSELLDIYKKNSSAKPENIAIREYALSQHLRKACMLDHAMGALIGREVGIVQVSPYHSRDQFDGIGHEEDLNVGYTQYFIDGEVRFLES